MVRRLVLRSRSMRYGRHQTMHPSAHRRYLCVSRLTALLCINKQKRTMGGVKSHKRNHPNGNSRPSGSKSPESLKRICHMSRKIHESHLLLHHDICPSLRRNLLHTFFTTSAQEKSRQKSSARSFRTVVTSSNVLLQGYARMAPHPIHTLPETSRHVIRPKECLTQPEAGMTEHLAQLPLTSSDFERRT